MFWEGDGMFTIGGNIWSGLNSVFVGVSLVARQLYFSIITTIKSCLTEIIMKSSDR